MLLNAPLGIFGGTFDPIHNGHLYPVIEAANKANIQQVALMPCFIPSHKKPASVSSEHRVAMVEKLCEDSNLFHIDTREIKRNTPTYSIDSLQELRQQFPQTPLCFFIGSDSLHSLPQWHRSDELLSLCHFIVCARQGESVDNKSTTEQVSKLVEQRQVSDPIKLHQSLAGNIYFANTELFSISSSEIRHKLASGQSVDDLIPPKVLFYIKQHKLYQPDTDFC